MGKLTRYHPISLHVIRGAAEFCGWKFGKIKNLLFDEHQSTATYRCDVERHPRGYEDFSASILKKQLQHCFTDDIRVTQVSTNSDGQISCTLLVRNPPNDQPGIEA